MIQSLNNQNFQSILQENSIVLVDFYADWCGPCQALAPTLENVSQKFDGKALIGKVNIDKNPELSQDFQVRSIPALFYIKNGKIVDKQVGLQSETTISNNITRLINN
ncbi:MAG: thioredoxin [Flavobacteriaceae bacterium]